MNLLTGLLSVCDVVTDPDNPTGGNPDAIVIAGERIEPDDVDVSADSDDTDDTDSDDVGDTDAGQQVDTDDTDYKTRYSDAQTAYARERQARTALENRIKKLEAGGINIAELEQLVGDTPGSTPQVGQQTVRPGPQDAVSRAEMGMFMQSMQYNMTKNAFLASNPEYREPKMNKILDYTIADIVNTQRAKGEPPSSMENLFKQAHKEVRSLVQSFTEKGKKQATQKRQKVKSQGADAGGDTGKTKTPSADEEETYDPRGSYVSEQAKVEADSKKVS